MYGTMLDALLTVLLSSTELFQDLWTQGNLNTLGWFTGKAGYVCCAIISFVGFGIVIFSISKNAITGLYVVNPKFWDKVSDLKLQSVELANSAITGVAQRVPGQGNMAAQRLGGFLTYVLNAIPNVKELTDFDGDDGIIDKKQWFAKSLPLMVAQIFIGMLIFYGYPSKIANWIGAGGTQMLDMLLTNVDPVATITGLSEKFIVADFAYEGSEDPYEHQVYQAASKGFTAVVGRVTDIQKQPRQDFAYALESDIYNDFQKYADTIGATDGYDVSVSATYLGNIPKRPDSWSEDPSTGVWFATASNGTITYRKSYTVSGYTLGSAGKVQDSDTLVITFTCTPVALKQTSTLSAILVARPGTAVQTSTGIKLPLDLGNFKYDKSGGDGTITGTPMAVSIIVPNGSDEVAISGTLEVEGNGLYINVKGAKGSTEIDTLKQNIQNVKTINFGYATSTLKVVSIAGSTKRSIPILGIEIGPSAGVRLSTQGTNDAPCGDKDSLATAVTSGVVSSGGATE